MRAPVIGVRLLCYNGKNRNCRRVIISAMRPNSPLYTYRDFLAWPEGERVEIVNGIPYAVTPAPSRLHQKILMELARQIGNFLKGYPRCEVYVAPFDVRLSEQMDVGDDQIDTVVQPDITIVCDKEKLDERGCFGAPTIVIEIISPSTATHDYIRKMALYEKHCVKEYWIVHPVDQIVMVFEHDGSIFGKPGIHDKEANVVSSVLPKLTVELRELFV